MTIVSPVSRRLVVADVARSVAFYRDVLGFIAQESQDFYGLPAALEVVSGAARIALGTREGAAGAAERRQIIFFETDDVAEWHNALNGRGAKPTELEKVNWIKMQMFEVRDPDGHTLWFGQSYHEHYIEMHTPAGRGQLRQILPELPLTDVPAGVAYYRDVLGFKINHAQDDLGVMDRDAITLLLIPKTERHKGIGSCYVYIRDADALYADLRAKGANVQGEPVSHPWGLRDFSVLDLEGNQITFGQTFE